MLLIKLIEKEDKIAYLTASTHCSSQPRASQSHLDFVTVPSPFSSTPRTSACDNPNEHAVASPWSAAILPPHDSLARAAASLATSTYRDSSYPLYHESGCPSTQLYGLANCSPHLPSNSLATLFFIFFLLTNNFCSNTKEGNVLKKRAAIFVRWIGNQF